MAFRFRQFSVTDEESTLRIGTDAMLLGSWANPGSAEKILDIGTGCGVLALMMAQKSEAVIHAIEIDCPSVDEAGKNFLNSPWNTRISAIHASLQSFAAGSENSYDFIITNPPYFSNSLKSPSARVNHARHDDSLSLAELSVISAGLLGNKGSLALIIPYSSGTRVTATFASAGLHLSRSLAVLPTTVAPPKRLLAEFTKKKVIHPLSSELTILDATGKFTTEYLALTFEFHNF